MGSAAVTSILLIVSFSSLALMTSSRRIKNPRSPTRSAFTTGAFAICAKTSLPDVCKSTVSTFPVSPRGPRKPDPLTILSMHVDKAGTDTAKAIVEMKKMSSNKTFLKTLTDIEVEGLRKCMASYPTSLDRIRALQKKLARRKLSGLVGDAKGVLDGYDACFFAFLEMLPFKEVDEFNTKLTNLANVAVDLAGMVK